MGGDSVDSLRSLKGPVLLGHWSRAFLFATIFFKEKEKGRDLLLYTGLGVGVHHIRHTRQHTPKQGMGRGVADLGTDRVLAPLALADFLFSML